MDDLERFGSRLEASLRRLADEVPTDVETDRYAATVVQLAGRRRGFVVPWGRGELELPRPLRLALVTAALVGLALALLLVSGGARPAVGTGLVHGELRCDQAVPLSTAANVELACDSDLPDPAFGGSVHLRFTAPTDFGPLSRRAGSMSIGGSDATWNGPVRVVVDATGLVAGDGTLAGDGAGAGKALLVRLLSADGVRWGVIGTVEHIR